MNGIVSYGAYLPRHRLDRAAIRATLGQGGGRGARTVAGYDEDTTSMAVEAARRARWGGALAPASLHFATTAPAYADKANATAIHAALGLDAGVFADDHASSVRSAIGALRAAAADGGLAVLADVRVGRPGSADEAGGGDGAAAFLFGRGDDVVAEVVGRAAVTAEFLDRWRTPGESASSTWEERFGLGEYLPLAEQAAQRALAAAGIERPDRVLVASPHGRVAKTVARGFGDAAADRLEPLAGNLGAAHLGVLLVDALDRAAPGDHLLALSVADGADALVLRVTDAIARRPAGQRIDDQLAAAAEVDYASFLTWRGRLDREPPRRPDPVRYEAPPAARAAAWKFAFVGSRCDGCARMHVPPQRVCAGCGTVDRMTAESLADVRGTIATYTVDRLAYSLSPPTVTVAVDFDGGGRFSCELTDGDPAAVAVGGRVEMSFRRMYSAQGVHNYFWKARPVVAAPAATTGEH
ncbi:OB-fold domain-containing protein [Patulibacter defluvii]|uniref:OB-fold domain-containing protein n=1 Tax=Patulibacter defluvii TaxID=3095358 RepID=UPI002A74AAF7|nr:OB-fold domain-containing protein [Patulibacter sp. DM4]